MPFVENQGAMIYWDEQGHGTPVLLIMGLGYPSQMWYRTRPLLASRYRTVALDNRGIGRSDVPPGPYPIALMASDAAAVLDAAGIESAHLFGWHGRAGVCAAIPEASAVADSGLHRGGRPDRGARRTRGCPDADDA